ncbi:hypothetical protein J2S59_001138 [Nocardioides massiliensis]|uniref:Protein kinase domain-containing protein n=3 Tax=Nocardioides massiliensis TaxID=1325935 RepID=A0ABT9NLN5_9ACTN|nr:protein kinase family protein [Nocardioides massiliensis]MDP9821329.1 hypothetical protein [Nocardioides massiliensis]
MADDAPPRPGDPWGHGAVLARRYRLEDLLTDHDGARFWRASDQILARDVAVHVLSADDPRARPVIAAARASAAVSDSRFLRVFDADIVGDVAYAVVEWGSGMSLDLLIAEAPLPPRRAAWLVKQVAEAISAAHAHGVAHGRLIPENVLVTETGSVKLIGSVIDAVLAQPREPWGPQGAALGDHESDVVNLAALLYVSLTGRWPGTSGSALPPAPAEQGRLLRPRQVRAGVPRPLDALCQRALQPEADPQGYAVETAHEIAAALSDFVGDPTGLHQPERAWTAPAVPVADLSPAGTEDPEATQAGAPMFFDDDTRVGWDGRSDAAADGGADGDGDAPTLGDTRRTPPPPPPPLPEPEPRPLFSPDAPRRPQPVSGFSTSTGTGTGTGSGVSPDGFWRWDDPGADDTAHGGSTTPGRGWLRVAATVGVLALLVVAVVVAFTLGQRGGGTPRADSGESPTESPSATGAPLDVVAVQDLDPPPAGNGEENAELVGNVVDGDPGTTWITKEYFDQFPALKPGVGLVLDLGEVQDVGSLGIRFVGAPTSVSIYAATEEPSSVDGLEEVASGTYDEAARIQLDETVSARYVVVWLTALPSSGSRFRGEIAEIVVRG